MNMKLAIYLLLATFCLAAVLGVTVFGAPKHSFEPHEGYVPDKKTAISIAEAVLSPIYGEKLVKKERPYTATLTNGVWTVEGSLHKGVFGDLVSGGVAEVEISKADGCILRVSH